MDDEVTVAGAARTKVTGLGNTSVFSGFFLAFRRIARVINDDSCIAGTGTIGRRPGRISRFDHGTATRCNNKVAAFHEDFRQVDGRVLDTLDDICRSPFAEQGSARMMSMILFVTTLALGWGEQIMTSRALIAYTI